MQWSYLDTALLGLISFYMMMAPFTKVEESFNIQAIHDIIKYGVVDISKYDHLRFPGVVPRTFIGSLVVSFCAKPFVILSSWLSRGKAANTEFETQLLVRSIIGLLNALSLVYLKTKAQELISKETDGKNEGHFDARKTTLTSVGTWFIVFVTSSFHLVYYASRPLPNFILALPLTNVALGWALSEKWDWSIFLFAFTAIVFRLEICAMGAGIAFLAIYYKKVTFVRAVKFGAMGLGLGAGLSLNIDSYFWRNWCIPEIDAFIFNVIKGNSTAWGVEPPTAYFTHYLRLIYIPPTILFLNLLGFRIAPTNIKIITLAALFHISVLSIQPHKEWRFIIYAIPPITLTGSIAIAYLWENVKMDSIMKMVVIMLLPITPFVSLFCSLAFLYISRMNYPGGEALMSFNNMVMENNITDSIVHLSVPACMTGVTLFGELDKGRYNVTYDKTENSDELEALWPSFDYLITTEPSPSYLPFEKNPSSNWQLVQNTTIYAGVNTTFLSEFVLQGNRTLFNIMKEAFVASDPATFFKKLAQNAVIKDDILFTYKRISDDNQLQTLTALNV